MKRTPMTFMIYIGTQVLSILTGLVYLLLGGIALMVLYGFLSALISVL